LGEANSTAVHPTKFVNKAEYQTFLFANIGFTYEYQNMLLIVAMVAKDSGFYSMTKKNVS
jgi:hypothetical protein